MTLLDSPVATAIQSLHLYPIVYPLSPKLPITGENLTQSGLILTAPSDWRNRQEWRNTSDYRGAGDGNRTRVISLED